MTSPSRVIKVDPSNPQVKAFVDAEKRLLDHYGLSCKTHMIELAELRAQVRVLEVGSGEPIVISPGGSGEAFVWIPLIAALKGWKCIVYDRPGGGLSDYVDYFQTNFRQLATRTISQVFNEFNLKSAPILGNSMGSLWNFWFAMDAPERVSKMAQIGCPALILNSSMPFPMRLFTAPVINHRVIRLTVPKNKESASQGLRMLGSSPQQIARLPRVFTDTFFYSRYLPNYQDAWRRLNERVQWLGFPRKDIRMMEEQLSTIHQPTLFIWGINDPFGNVQVGQRAARAMPNATFTALPTGHLPYVDEPEECAKLLRKFLS